MENFFKEHPDMDIDNMVERFIDIMEVLNEKMSKTMNNSVVVDILDKLNIMGTKMNKIEEGMGRMNTDIHNNFEIKMNELKKDYIEELKMVMTCNVSDKIAPLLKEQNSVLFNKTTSIINEIIPKNEELVLKSMNKMVDEFQLKIKEDSEECLTNVVDRETFEKSLLNLNTGFTKMIETSQKLLNSSLSTTEQRLENKMDKISKDTCLGNQTTNSLNTSISDLLKKFENSNRKGAISENLTFSVLSDLYPSAEIENVGQTKETGDLMLMRHNKPTILVENKYWTRPVTQGEVVKFIRDTEIQNCCGLFLSQNARITVKENFEIDIHNGNILIYCHDVNNDPDKIKLAIEILDNLKETWDELHEDDVSNVSGITKEMMEVINSEYQNFRTSKLSLIKMAKEFNKNILKEIDDIKIPTLDDYLTKMFAFSCNNKFECEYCGFVGKNKQSKSAHMRACQVRKQKEGNVTEIVCNTVIN